MENEKRREIQSGEKVMVTEEIRKWVQDSLSRDNRERKMKDGKSEICSCRDTLAGPMEIRRVLLQITRDNEI